MTILRRILLTGLGLGLLAAAAAGVLVWQTNRWADQPLEALSQQDAPVIVLLEAGRTFGSLVREMRARDLLTTQFAAWQLRLLGKLSGQERQLKSGEYLLQPGTTPRSLLAKMVAGDVMIHEVRIIEGLTTGQTLRVLSADARMRQDVELQDTEQLLAHLLPYMNTRDLRLPGFSGGSAEGLLFPDTYQIMRGAAFSGLLERAYVALHERVMQAWAARDQPSTLQTPYELLILASIIEKETGLADDRADISQVFHNRLRRNMMLQTDPTVIYALGEAFDGNLTRAHLRIDSPYNTYRYKGLPPGPIALPSAAALQAAAQPTQGPYLYFVASGDGGSIFSRTLAEHNAAVRRYQLGQQ